MKHSPRRDARFLCQSVKRAIKRRYGIEVQVVSRDWLKDHGYSSGAGLAGVLYEGTIGDDSLNDLRNRYALSRAWLEEHGYQEGDETCWFPEDTDLVYLEAYAGYLLIAYEK